MCSIAATGAEEVEAIKLNSSGRVETWSPWLIQTSIREPEPKPSKSGEVEIVDLLNIYRSKKKLTAQLIGRGGAWLDTGSIDDFYKTSSFVSAIENRQGLKIACIEEIAFNNGWITKKQIINLIRFYGNCDYSKYLKNLIKK